MGEAGEGGRWLEPRPWLTAVIKSSYLTRDVTGNCCLRALRPLCRFNYLWRCDSKAINNNPSWSLHTEALPCVFSWHRDQRQRIAKKQNLNRPVMAVPRLLNLFFYPRPLLSSIKCYRLWNCSLYMSRFYCSKKMRTRARESWKGVGFWVWSALHLPARVIIPPRDFFLAHFPNCLFKPSRGIILALISALALL